MPDETTKTLSDEDRERLDALLDQFDESEDALMAAMRPFRVAYDSVIEARSSMLEQFGVDERGKCEGCGKRLYEGDKACTIAEGGNLCEDCAPTYADIKRQAEEAEDSDYEFPEDRAESLAAMNAMEARGEDMSAKAVFPL